MKNEFEKLRAEELLDTFTELKKQEFNLNRKLRLCRIELNRRLKESEQASEKEVNENEHH